MHTFMAGFGVILYGAVGVASAQQLALESVGERGFLLPPGAHRGAVISADGRYLAYEAHNDEVSGDDDHLIDIVLRDRLTGALRNVSVSSAGDNSDAHARAPSISADGRYVTFQSRASNLVTGDVDGVEDVFVRDVWTSTTRKVSGGLGGQPHPSGAWGALISADGSTVVFHSPSDNHVVGDTNGTFDVFAVALASGLTTRVSLSDTGGELSDWSTVTSVSGDGNVISFVTGSPGVVGGNPANVGQVYVRDRVTNTTELVSASDAGIAGNQSASLGVLSRNGRFVTFESYSNNLHPFDTDTNADIFVRDRLMGTLDLVSQTNQVVAGFERVNKGPATISEDGRRVAYESSATDLGGSTVAGGHHAYVYDRIAGLTTPVNVTASGEFVGPIMSYTMSPDARYVVFTTTVEVFVRDLSLASPPDDSTYCATAAHSSGCSGLASVAGFPSVAGPASLFVTARNMIADATGSFIWGLSATELPFHGSTLCVAQPLVRTPVQNSGSATPWSLPGCRGGFSFHFTPIYYSQRGLSAGTTLYGQFYQRDTVAGPNRFAMSSAVSFTLAP